MATDWASDVKKYAPDADDGVIAGIVRYCGIALQKVDSSLVSFSDPAELARVRTNFLKKKCGLTDSDEMLDAAIADVGERMKDDRTKNRVTVYYLLADRFGLHSQFVKAAKTTTAKAAPVAAGAAVALAALDGSGGGDAARVSPVVETEKVSLSAAVEPVVVSTTSASTTPMAAMAAVGTAGAATALGLTPLRHPIGRTGVWGLLADGGAGKSGRGFYWFALALLALALVWLFFLHKPATYTAAAPVIAPAARTVEEVAIPEGAGIIAETRDEKPVVKVYFETGKADVAPAFAGEATAFKTYLDANPGSSLGVSGYNDPTGNTAANAALSKKRAQAVKAALVAAAIPDAAVELIKPEAATDTRTTNAEARRVEVYIK
jgi:outer membrane protein OmpA-like peptidoglycan-associated protein